jgi:outer membrane immunogenic protein
VAPESMSWLPAGGLDSLEVQERMKKIVLIAFLLAGSAVVCSAQESRQDMSLSGTALSEPFMASSTDVQVSASPAYGALLSYRFMVTPTSALEANYGITYQNNISFFANPNHYHILTRTQEISGAYVRSFVYRNFNPFIEAGPAGFIFLPIRNTGTNNQDVKQQTEVGGVYGGGIAYEISPSFDIRAEYRGLVTKVPNFGVPQLSTNRWYNIYEPVVGVAYHF